MWVHRCMIVAASIQAQAQALAANFPGGSGMWTTGVSQTGDAPATHYITAGMIWPQFAQMLASPQELVDGCAALGTTVAIDDAAALLNSADVSVDEPFDALARLGLKLINTGGL